MIVGDDDLFQIFAGLQDVPDQPMRVGARKGRIDEDHRPLALDERMVGMEAARAGGDDLDLEISAQARNDIRGVIGHSPFS
ncbi:hypothetical protein ADT71_12180 [Novosphingobium sp. ST904]|nr:hypothetical protein ADT71_12180 [Novosphingobium sp. ST904]